MSRKLTLSGRQVEQKAYELWCKAGRPEGEYPRYEKTVHKWNRKGLTHGEFEKHLKGNCSTREEKRGIRLERFLDGFKRRKSLPHSSINH